jgi:hypothetical protein
MPNRNGKSKKRIRRPRRGQSMSQYTPNSVFEAQTLALNQRFRWRATTTGNYDVTVAQLLDACGVFAINSTLATSIWSCVKLKCVEIWAPPYSAGNAISTANVKLNWNSIGTTLSSPIRDIDATSLNPSQPTHIKSKPPSGQNYFCGEWNDSASTILFTMALPASCLVELTVDLALKDFGDNNTTTSRTIAGGTSGGIYCTALDNLLSSSGNLQPTNLGRAAI